MDAFEIIMDKWFTKEDEEDERRQRHPERPAGQPGVTDIDPSGRWFDGEWWDGGSDYPSD